MDLEVIHVFQVTVDADVLHALVDSSLKAGSLVAGEVEPPAGLQELQQCLELGGRFRGAHSACSPTTRVLSAEDISSNGRTKSTFPVSMAAPGIPKNSDVFWSCARTVPPIFLTAVEPIAPSVPVPVRTT